MLDFKEITLQDKPWIDELLSYSNYNATEYNFTVLFIWRKIYQTKVCRYKDYLLIRSYPENLGINTYHYIFPAGKGSEADLQEAINLCIKDANELGHKINFSSVLQPQKDFLENLYPDRFSYLQIRDSYDYIYSAQDLVFLKGKKFQSKRNFISRFKRDAVWEYEQINESNLGECAVMNDKWCAKYGCGMDLSMNQEYCSVRCALENFVELKLSGGILRLNGEVVAFTVGEKMSSNTFLVHIEKAFADVVGAYPTIANEYLRHTILNEQTGELSVEFINREDDAGDLGLREAKMQYHPLFLLEKFSVCEK